MWNIKKSSEEETVAKPSSRAASSSGNMFMNPYEITKTELMRKIKFFAVYIGGMVVVPELLRSLGLIAPLAEIPLSRR